MLSVGQIVWAFVSEDVLTTILGLEFSSRGLVISWSVVAWICVSVLILVNLKWLARVFRFKSHRFGDLQPEIAELCEILGRDLELIAVPGARAAADLRRRRLRTKLRKLDIETPTSTTEWVDFLARLGVLAKERDLNAAKDLPAPVRERDHD